MRSAWADNLKIVRVAGLIVVVRLLHWPPEAAHLAVSSLGVLISFSLGWLMTRIPGVARVV